MPVPIVIIFMIMGLFLGLLLMIGGKIENKPEAFFAGVLLVCGGLSFGAWFSAAYQQPLTIASETIAEVVKVGDTQCATYRTESGNVEIMNLTKTIGRVFEIGQKIKITVYNRTAGGIDWYVKEKVQVEIYNEKESSNGMESKTNRTKS